jgi:protein-tyrosine-phosphatase
MAEAMLRARLETRAPEVTVGSCGLLFDDRPAEPGAVRAMARRGLDLGPFRSRVMSAELFEGSSLILVMERMHVREVSVRAPELFGRTFTLPEFVDQADPFGPRGEEPLLDWVTGVGQMRRPTDYLIEDVRSEVPDPMGQSGRAFRRIADQIDDLLARLVDLAWPLDDDARLAPDPLAPSTPGDH